MSKGPVIILGQTDPRVMMEASLTFMFTKVLSNLSSLTNPQPELVASVQEMQATRNAVNAAMVSPAVTPATLGTLNDHYKAACQKAHELAVATQDPDLVGSVRCLVDFSDGIDKNYPRAELSY